MQPPKETLQESIAAQRRELKTLLAAPLAAVARAVAAVWPDRARLDAVLEEMLPRVPHCKYLYALDVHGVQISDNVGHEGIVEADFGRDRSERPYLREAVPADGFRLSQAYISLREKRPALTAIQLVRNASGLVLGFVGADFFLHDLPLTRELYEEPRYWRQIKGDPSIRGTVFHQTRAESEMDRHIDTVLGVVEELMVDHGVYHVILHFSSSRAVLWVIDDPYRYRLLGIEALIDPDSCLAYPRRPYPAGVAVPKESIRPVLDQLKALRFMDEMFYLRSGTLNLFNGIVGLTFSCDGSHYIPYDEFLRMDQAFWLGSVGNP
ncbi:MAG: PDC sensor domain-containing protein [Burkholderiales bacterium]|nr:PDC sensor domain-containing protein [Burkholderiales bacterium]